MANKKELDIGTKIPNITFTDANNQEWELGEINGFIDYADSVVIYFQKTKVAQPLKIKRKFKRRKIR